MKYLYFLSICVIFISCDTSNNNSDTQPRTFRNIGYQVEGSNQRISISYTNIDGDHIADTTSVPWQKTFGSLTLAPGEEFNTNLEVTSLSSKNEELIAFILNGTNGSSNDYSALEIQNGTNLSINLSNKFFNPSEYPSDILMAATPQVYSVTGTEQEVIITHKDINEKIVTDTLSLPWRKAFYLNFNPGESFDAVLNVKSLSEKEETINASIREVKETRTGTNLEINLSNTIPGRFTSRN